MALPHERTSAALLRLDELTRRLRRECPWDREQDERSIVPHTVEEAYELADAAHSGDDAKLRDELGDVLFQVYFLALLLEERAAGSLAAVADHCSEKLIRRHPHVFGDAHAADAGEVRRNWDEIKRTQEGRAALFGDLPENLPGLLRARKAQRRAASTGFDFPGVDVAAEALRDELAELEGAPDADARFHEVGDVLFAAVNVARKLSVDPELALRAATDRFCGRVGGAEAEAAGVGESWAELPLERQLEHYARARLREAPDPPKGGQ
ncbi:MAG: nucleoside triphosphate diphosphatase [Solirubrobacteraceae bacterium]|jgi:XTP/dITP diphosphohydrolase/tetrapyrrole methylase family protein/MazG family protein/ATP diphosphatase|nr:nucleoside triphosphate diphosphatase [Solirubrobacteraceae bacterium]